jgi:hypothetical protein
VQACPAAHVVPQVPQLAPSVERSAHVPAQFVVPEGHPHAPFVQMRLLPQICEQSPQFCLLVCRSAHDAMTPVPHSVKPEAVQRIAQTPSLHSGSAPEQRSPQVPQFRVSLVTSTQLPNPPKWPAHCVSPVGHAQVPSVQRTPPAHAVPQAPQFLLSVDRSTQVVPQSVSPVSQVPLHAPATQVVPRMQRMPQPPQFAGSVSVSVHDAPQRIVPVPHEQAPATQFAPFAHCVLQLPQLFGSVATSTHEAPQVVVPAPHDVVQVPAEHTSPFAHTFPHAPQLLGSLSVAVQTPSHRVPSLMHWQAPAWHEVPAVQRTPQPPQLELSS